MVLIIKEGVIPKVLLNDLLFEIFEDFHRSNANRRTFEISFLRGNRS